MINASHHDLRHAAGAGIFCNLYCRVVAIDRRDLRASCSARRRFSRRRFAFSPLTSLISGVWTKSAVKPL